MVHKFMYHPHFRQWYIIYVPSSLSTIVHRFRYYPLIWQWYLNLSVLSLSMVVPNFRYHLPFDDGTEIYVPSSFQPWYLNLSTFPCARMALKFQCHPSYIWSYLNIYLIRWSQPLRRLATIAFSVPHHHPDATTWSALTVRYSELAVLPIPDLFLLAIAYVYTFCTQYMRSIAMQIVV